MGLSLRSLPARDHVVALVELGQQAGDVGRIVLQVGVQRHDHVVARGVDAGGHRRGLAEVAAEADQAEMRIGRAGGLEVVPGAVARAVVHEDDLVGAADARNGRVELLRQGGDVRLFVEDGNDDREARGGRSCHARSMGQAGRHFKRGLF